MTCLLGLDLGTTGSKALLIAPDGAIVASATVDYPLSTPHPLWAEQDPADWWSGTVSAIRTVLASSGIAPADIAGVGLTGQMHGLVLLDGGGRVLRPAILWNDQRTGSECASITREIGAERIIELTGNPVLPGFTAPKILWVRHHEPEVYARVAAVLLPKDFIRFELTGERLGEVSDASGTSLFDVGRRTWSGEMLRALDIPRAWLPEITESPVASARISREAALATGLVEGTPVVGGAGDQAAQAVGSGIVDEGAVSITLGTSGVVFASSTRYRIDPQGRLHAFCHAAPALWHLMGVMLSAGGSLRWYRDALGTEEKRRAAETGLDTYDVLLEAAAGVSAGADGLFFLPYLTGERTPYPDPDARGVFFGLTLRHGKSHLTRAVVEGISFGLRDSLELMRATGLSIGAVRVSGGGARSPLWRQILADVCEAEVVTLNVTEGAAFGAALLAGVGTGVFPDVRTASARVVRETGRTRPGPGAAFYQRQYPFFRSLYQALAPRFKALANL